MGAFVYMLRCADGTYYVGSATGEDLSMRVAEHNVGKFQGYTSTRRPVMLVWITDAIAAERKLKGWSRAKKEALIAGDWDTVSRLSGRRGGKPRTALSEPRHPEVPERSEGLEG